MARGFVAYTLERQAADIRTLLSTQLLTLYRLCYASFQHNKQNSKGRPEAILTYGMESLLRPLKSRSCFVCGKVAELVNEFFLDVHAVIQLLEELLIASGWIDVSAIGEIRRLLQMGLQAGWPP